MSADSPRRGLNTRGGVAVPAMVPPQVVSDRSILDSAIGFISDVTLAHQPHTDHKDTITWARFESMADISDPRYGEDWELEGNVAPPLLLILGYGLGVQVWAIPANGEAVEVLSWRHGTVSALRVLPTPPTYAENGRADAPADAFAEKRPLMAMCDGASSCGGAGGGGSQPQFCAVNFVSLKSGTQVKTIKFKNPVLDILANRSSIVVTFHERIAVFDARTLEDRLSITTCYPSPGINPNPVALGPRWMAYSEHKLLHSKRSGGGCDGEGVASYTATVLNAAKSFGKGLRELGEQVAAGLTGTAGSGGNSKNSSFDSTSSGDLKQPGIVTIMDIKHPIKDVSPTSGTPISINGNDPFVAHFIAHSEAVVALEFDNSGMLLVTADKRGHDFHVFRIQPHPVGSSLAAVHHLYVLHRGDTSAKVQNIAFSLDSRWVAVSTLRGTTHVFPITPYGGPMGVRTHTSLHVVNKLSRFHRSAGLSADGRSSSPISHSESTTFSQSLIPYNNPTLPPYPRPTVVLPLAQLRQPFVLGSPPGSAMPSKTSAGSSSSSSSQRQRLSSLSDDNGKPLSVCAIFAKSRSWLLDPPNATREAPHRIQRKAVDSLFVMAGHGALIQYDLDTKLASNVAKEKICDDTPIELEVEAKAQWNLGRKDGSQEIMPPLTMDNWLIKDRNSCMLTDSTRQFDETDDRADSWLSQVEIITHAGPHRRLWMGPQFVFKTYNTPSGSNLSHIEAEAVEIGVSATSSSSAAARTERSSPLNMPLSATGRAAVPVLIESGSYSSIEQSPKLMDRFRHEHLDSDFSVAHGDSRLKEDLADAMRESPSVSATRRDAGRSISVVASDHAPFYDALAEHVDDDSAADSSSTVTTGYGSGYGSGSGGSSFDPTRSAAAALANALPNISSFESSSGPGPSSIEKVVNPLGTVTTITSGGMSTEVHSTDILDEVVSQLAAEDCVIHENCDEALFRPVVAIFCDEKSRVQGEEARRRQQELCKPPEVIGHKLIVPVIAKERDAELTKKEQLKLAGGKRDQSAAGEEQQQQQSKFDEMARKNKKGAAAAAGVTENVKKTGEKRGREEVQEASLPEKDAEESGKAERATEEKPKSAGKPKGKSVKDNVDKEAVEEPPMEFQRMTPKPAATAKKTTTTTTTTEKGRRSEEREVTRATTTREDHKAQEAAAKKKEKEKDVAKRAKEEKPEAKKSEKKSKEEENKAEVEEKVGDAKRETKQTADNTKQSAKTEKTALALANNSSSKAKPKTAATSEDDEVEQADKSMDEGKSVGKSVKALEKLDADEDGSKEEKEAIAMGSKSRIKTEKLNVAELTDSLIELGESERKNSASSLEGKATGVELKESQSTVERKESKSNTVELKEPVDIYSVENTVKSSKKKMKQRQSRSASSGSEAEEVVEAMPAKTVVKKTTSERKSSAGAEVEELQTGPAHIEKKSSTSSEDSFADLADSLLENKQNIEETMYISFSEVPDRDFAEEEEGEEDFVRAQSQEELREREKSKECASKSSSDSSTTSDSSNTEKSVRVAAAGKTKATEQVKVKPEEAKKPPEVLKKEEPEAKAKPKEAKANRKKSIEEENVKVNVNVKSKAETSSEKKCLEDSTSAPEDAKRPATKAPKEEAKGAVKKQALKTADKTSVEAVEEKENWKKTSDRKEDDEKAKKDPVSALKDKKSNVEVSEKTSKDDRSLSPPAGAKLNLADLLKGDSAAMPPPAGPVVSVAEGKKSKKSAKAETKFTQESTATSTATATAPIVEQPKRAKKDPKDEVVKPSVAKDSDSGTQSSETCDDYQISKKANKVKAGDKSGSSQDLVDTASTSSSSGTATALKKDKASDEPLVFVNKFMSKFSPEQKKKKKPTAVEPPMVDSGKSVEAPKSTETAPAPAPPSVWKTLSGADMISKNLEAINKSPVEDVGYPSLEPKPSGKVSNSNKKSKPSDDLKASTWLEPLVPTAAAAKGWPEEEPVSGASSSSSTSTNKSGKKSKKAPPTSFDDFPMLKPLDALPPLPVLEPLEVLTPITTTTTKVGAAVAKDSQVSLINFESPEENPALERKITPPPRGFTERNLILALCGSLHYEDETTRPAAPYASLAYESLVETSDQHYRSLEQSSQETETELELETNESNEKTSNENTSSSSVSTSGTSSASEEVIVVFEEKKLSKKQRRKKELLEQQQKLQDQQQQEPKLGCKKNDADADGDDADADDDDEELRPLISMSESQAETFVDPMPVMMTSSGSGQYFVPLATGAAGATTSLQMEDSFGRSGGTTTTDSEGPMPGTTTTSDDGRGVAASASASASGSANKLKTKKLEHKINLIAAIEAATSSSTSSAEESGVEGGGGGGGAGRSDPDTAVVAMASSSSLSAAAAAAAPLSTAASATAATSSTLLGSHVASSVGQQSASKKKTKRRKR